MLVREFQMPFTHLSLFSVYEPLSLLLGSYLLHADFLIPYSVSASGPLGKWPNDSDRILIR